PGDRVGPDPASAAPARQGGGGHPVPLHRGLRAADRAELRRLVRGGRLSSYEARIEVGHRPGILDPQGGVIERALPALGYGNVSHVRVGKSIRLVVEAADEGAARAEVEEMCRKLLANPVIEDYTI